MSLMMDEAFLYLKWIILDLLTFSKGIIYRNYLFITLNITKCQPYRSESLFSLLSWYFRPPHTHASSVVCPNHHFFFKDFLLHRLNRETASLLCVFSVTQRVCIHLIHQYPPACRLLHPHQTDFNFWALAWVCSNLPTVNSLLSPSSWVALLKWNPKWSFTLYHQYAPWHTKCLHGYPAWMFSAFSGSLSPLGPPLYTQVVHAPHVNFNHFPQVFFLTVTIISPQL